MTQSRSWGPGGGIDRRRPSVTNVCWRALSLSDATPASGQPAVPGSSTGARPTTVAVGLLIGAPLPRPARWTRTLQGAIRLKEDPRPSGPSQPIRDRHTPSAGAGAAAWRERCPGKSAGSNGPSSGAETRSRVSLQPRSHRPILPGRPAYEMPIWPTSRAAAACCLRQGRQRRQIRHCPFGSCQTGPTSVRFSRRSRRRSVAMSALTRSSTLGEAWRRCPATLRSGGPSGSATATSTTGRRLRTG